MSEVICSFCETPNTEVLHMIKGKTGAICNLCVADCLRIISDKWPNITAPMEFEKTFQENQKDILA